MLRVYFYTVIILIVFTFTRFMHWHLRFDTKFADTPESLEKRWENDVDAESYSRNHAKYAVLLAFDMFWGKFQLQLQPMDKIPFADWRISCTLNKCIECSCLYRKHQNMANRAQNHPKYCQIFDRFAQIFNIKRMPIYYPDIYVLNKMCSVILFPCSKWMTIIWFNQAAD